MIADLAEYSIMNLRHRSLRSWLTIIGIIIGVFSIVVMISIAQGLDAYIRNQLSFLGSDVISVQPGGSLSGGGSAYGAQAPLTENDVNALKKIPDISTIGYSMEGRASVQYRDKNITMYIAGADPDVIAELYPFTLESGRLLKENDRGAIVIGNKIAHEVFKEDIDVGRRLMVGNKSFTVVGVLAKGGGLTSTLDNIAYIPAADARLVIPVFTGNRDVSEIDVKIIEGADPNDVAQQMTDALLRSRKLKSDDRDFTVITAAYISEQVGNITTALGVFLGGIAAISMLVGSIGIANTMFMSVMERTREIGIMKALGASDSVIRSVFLIEAGIIGTIGGILGLALSIAVSAVINYFGVPSSVNPLLMAGAVLFSFTVGMLSGYIPAQNAAKLNAVEALRYE